jgi:hypothetical protein
MVEVPAAVVAQLEHPQQAARATLSLVLMIRIPAVQAHLLLQALAAADQVLPALEALAEIGEQLVLQANQASRRVAPQVSQYKDGLR